MEEGGSQHGPPPPSPPPPPLPPPLYSPPPASSLPPPPGTFEEEEPERSSSSGNRWPREETVALLEIRSELDAEFRQATLKGPLWEEVSRRLRALGYTRSGKKCREKFENVHKYYKRTKDHRASRPDGKSYRFFTQLEALQNISCSTNENKNNGGGNNGGNNKNNNNATTEVATNVNVNVNPCIGGVEVRNKILPQPPQPTLPPLPLIPISSMAPPPNPDLVRIAGSGSSSASDTEETDHEEPRKRKRGVDGSRATKMMEFFEGIMKEVMDRQEAMQIKFLEAIERIEQERLLREENWRRQEAARNARESDVASRERMAAAARDAGIMALLQKIASRGSPVVGTTPPAAAAAEMSGLPDVGETPTPAVVAADEQRMEVGSSGGGGSGEAASSRWPQEEVHALIGIRTSMESRYQEAGPKGPLWEDISAAMGRMGYRRSAKRCKEKWENINKYFKRVKDSNKKRPEDSKTCPYFHQLDTIYRSKSAAAAAAKPSETPLLPPPDQHPLGGGSEVEEQRSNSGDRSPCSSQGQKEDATYEKKPEDTLMEERLQQNCSIRHRRDPNQMEDNGFGGAEIEEEEGDQEEEEQGDEEEEEEDHINVAKRGMSNSLESLSSKPSGSSSADISKAIVSGTGSTFLALWSRNGENLPSCDM